ncbi:uncharacterized protein LOC123316922 [Coccinella septempunctata]|uniref:uncharacterized protein LOC123316922 n=1 Tax=Coccinella septempunctata TaxID=41139 RepID=UPI001D06B26B|nr:uncharacterized protein LOC123316922 [Coccinella septempunctata]
MAADIYVTQINLQHCIAATDILRLRLIKLHKFLTLIQEPWIRGGEVRGLSFKGGRLFFSPKDTNPRACILASTDLRAQLLTNFCFRDLVAVQILDCRGPLKNLVVCSAHLPYDSPDPPPSRELEELVEFCQRKGWPLLVGCDANAHHILWGQPEGGDEPTFVTSSTREVLDITLCSSSIADFFENWRVATEVISLSDHRHICFTIKGNRISKDPEIFRNPRRTDWSNYLTDLSDNLGQENLVPKNTRELDTAADKLQECIISAYHSSCRPQFRRPKGQTKWWTPELTDARLTSRHLFNRAMRSGLGNDWDDYKSAMKRYKGLIRKSKRESWGRFCSDIEGAPETNRLRKILSAGGTVTMDYSKLPTGHKTCSEEESLRHLLEAHFPGFTENNNTQDERQRHASREDWKLASQVVTQSRIRWAINGFEPYKAAGEDGIIPALLIEGLPHCLTYSERV